MPAPEQAVDEVATELIAAGIAADAGAVGFAFGEQALVAAAVGQLQFAGAFVLVVGELAAVGLVVLLEGAFAVAPAMLESARVVATGCGQIAQAMEQAFGELTSVDLAITAVPLALAMPLAVEESAGVPTPIGVVDAPFALQQAVDHLPSVAAPSGRRASGGDKGSPSPQAASSRIKVKGSSARMADSGQTMRRVCRRMRRRRYWAPHAYGLCGPFAGKAAPTGFAVLLMEAPRLWERFTREGLAGCPESDEAQREWLGNIGRFFLAFDFQGGGDLEQPLPGLFSVASASSTLRRTRLSTFTGWMNRTLSSP